jgi:transglutaminase-like putative cysteine protease
MAQRISVIADGNMGVYQTVELMRQLIHSPSPRADKIAAKLLTDHPGANAFTRAAAVHAFILNHMAYVYDDPAMEELYHPELLFAKLENRGVTMGDCDDFVIATCSLLRRVNVACEIVLASSRQDKQYDHVYAQAITEYGPVPMDAIYGEPFGWSAVREFTALEELPL